MSLCSDFSLLAYISFRWFKLAENRPFQFSNRYRSKLSLNLLLLRLENGLEETDLSKTLIEIEKKHNC